MSTHPCVKTPRTPHATFLRALHAKESGALLQNHADLQQAALGLLAPHPISIAKSRIDGAPTLLWTPHDQQQALGCSEEKTRVVAALRELARKRICRKDVTCGDYLTKFQQHETLAHVVEALEAIQASFVRGEELVLCVDPTHTLALSPLVTAQFWADNSGNSSTTPYLHHALLSVSGALYSRAIHAARLLRGQELSALDLEVPGFEIRKHILEVEGPQAVQLKQFDASEALLRQGQLCIRNVQHNAEDGTLTLTYEWAIPDAWEKMVRCSVESSSHDLRSVSWVKASDAEDPVAVHFDHVPRCVRRVALTATLARDLRHCEVTHVHPIEWAGSTDFLWSMRKSPWTVIFCTIMLTFGRMPPLVFMALALTGSLCYLHRSFEPTFEETLDSLSKHFDLADDPDSAAESADDDDID